MSNIQVPTAKPLNILIACEYSGSVRDECIKRGHNAVSCDILPSDKPGPHHQGDVRDILGNGWDMMVGHPPCTHLSLSGARWCTDHWVKRKQGNRWHDGTQKRKERDEALSFFRLLWEADIPHIALEQPMSVAVRVAPKSQTIQPWQFGHGECKTTWLWLKNLPPLEPTEIVEGREQNIWKMPPSEDRWKLRSLTFPGIAEAMASQWCSYAERQRLPSVIRNPIGEVCEHNYPKAYWCKECHAA